MGKQPTPTTREHRAELAAQRQAARSAAAMQAAIAAVTRDWPAPAPPPTGTGARYPDSRSAQAMRLLRRAKRAEAIRAEHTHTTRIAEREASAPVRARAAALKPLVSAWRVARRAASQARSAARRAHARYVAAHRAALALSRANTDPGTRMGVGVGVDDSATWAAVQGLYAAWLRAAARAEALDGATEQARQHVLAVLDAALARPTHTLAPPVPSDSHKE